MMNVINEESVTVAVEQVEEDWKITVTAEVETENMVKVVHRVHAGEKLLAGQANFVMQSGAMETVIMLPVARVESEQDYLLKSELHDLSKEPSTRISQQFERPITFD